MPNWCSTYYVVHGSKIGVEKFKETLEEIKKDPPKLKNGAVADNAGDWLGSIVEYCGGDSDKIGCRGWFTYVDDYIEEDEISAGDYTFKFGVEDAWGPHPVPIKMLVEKIRYDHGVLLDYDLLADEPGCEIYIRTDDKYHPNKYNLNFNIEGKEDWLVFDNDKELVKYLNENFELEYSVNDIDQLIDCLREKAADDPDSYFSLYEYELVDKEA